VVSRYALTLLKQLPRFDLDSEINFESASPPR